jgi:hypothetical protein
LERFGSLPLAHGRGAAVEGDHLDLVAVDAAIGVRLVDGHHRAALDQKRILGIGAGERQGEADLDGLLLRLEARHTDQPGHDRGCTARVFGWCHGVSLTAFDGDAGR